MSDWTPKSAMHKNMVFMVLTILILSLAYVSHAATLPEQESRHTRSLAYNERLGNRPIDPSVEDENGNRNSRRVVNVNPLNMDSLDYQMQIHSIFGDANLDDKSRGSVRRDTGSGSKAKEPKCIEGLCENVEDYPKDDILNTLKALGTYDEYFKALEVNILSNRYNLYDDEMTMCKTKQHTIYPEKANNTKNIEKTIVNVDGYKQGIVFDVCLEETPCEFSEMFPISYTSSCKQKYLTRRLMVLGDEKEKFAFDTFDIPSCCVCVYRKI